MIQETVTKDKIVDMRHICRLVTFNLTGQNCEHPSDTLKMFLTDNIPDECETTK